MLFPSESLPVDGFQSLNLSFHSHVPPDSGCFFVSRIRVDLRFGVQIGLLRVMLSLQVCLEVGKEKKSGSSKNSCQSLLS